MPKQDSDNTLLSLILEGQKDFKEDFKEFRSDIKDVREDLSGISVNMATQGANLDNINKQMSRVLDTINIHGNLLAEHAERFSSLEASQESYYRYKKQSVDELDSVVPVKIQNKTFFQFPPKSTKDFIKFLSVSLVSAGLLIGGVLKAFGIIDF